MGDNPLSAGYAEALRDAKQLINQAREAFLVAANRYGMEMRWHLGKLIDEHSERFKWGKSVIKNFSEDLMLSFPDNQSFSARNLAYMRQLYSEYKNSPELAGLAKDVRWGTNIIIINKVKSDDARRFYLQMAAEAKCSRSVMVAQISSKAYERECLQDKKHNFSRTLPEILAARAENVIKSSYLFEVAEPLGLTSKLSERVVENQMVVRIKETIMMLGKGFAFIGNQYRITVNDKDYFIDMLFMNRITRSLIAVELKLGEFKIEYAGKMSLYLNLLDEHVKLPDENPSIGLILCNDKNNIEVDYALRDIKKPVGIAELQLSKVLPDSLIGKLPDPDELRERLLQNLKDK